jgi:hypothetical protein
MNKKNYLSSSRLLPAAMLSTLLSFSSCAIDTISEPDGIISGELRDAVALANGEDPTFWSEQPNGYQIYCTETSWTESETTGSVGFWGKADGTFYNCRIFPATYRVAPSNGAFHSVASQEVTVKSNKETSFVFDVIPYCSFHDVSIEKDPVTAGSLIIRFKVTTNPRPDDPSTPDVDESRPATIRNWRFFASSRTPYVGNNVYDTDVSTNSDQALTADDLGREIVYVRTGFKPGVTYWLRLGARCNETSSARYNMTKIYQVTF